MALEDSLAPAAHGRFWEDADGGEVLDGGAVAAAIRAELGDEVERLAAAGRRPTLAAVLVGDDEASRIYVGSKQRAAGRSGIGSRRVELPADAAQKDVLAAVAGLNADDGVHGILVQLPAGQAGPGRGPGRHRPGQGRRRAAPRERGAAAAGDPGSPCTAIGIVELLRRERVPVEGSHVVIVGRGLLVGRPLAVLLSAKAPGANATVTLCHTGTGACPGSPGRPTCWWRRPAGRP